MNFLELVALIIINVVVTLGVNYMFMDWEDRMEEEDAY